MKLRFVFVLIALMMLSGTAGAATITICDSGCNYTIDGVDDDIEGNWAISNASSGDIIEAQSNMNLNNSLNFTDYNNVPDNITFRGSNNSIILNITHKNLTGIEIRDVKGIAIYSFIYKIGFTGLGTAGGTLYCISCGFNISGASDDIYIFDVTMTKYDSTTRLHNAIKMAGVATDYIKNVTIRDNYMRGIVALLYVDNATLNNNSVTEARGSGVDINSNSKNVSIYNNHVFDNANIDLKAYIATSWIVFRNNTANGSQHGMGAYAGGSNNVWENNSIWGESIACIQIAPQYSQSNNTFKNNRCYDSVRGVDAKTFDATKTSYTNLTNNVFYNISGDVVWLYGLNVFINLTNNIIVNNSGYGINQSSGTIYSSYNDIWNNTAGNYLGTIQGSNNISSDPLFANVTYGFYDFHLQSAYGRWNGSAWVTDASTSPAIDAGDPSSDYSKETEPNGNRINMGAYGNTVEASLSATTDVPPSTPGIPINIASTYGKYWINTTWQAAEGNVTTDSYNVSVNGTWYNGTLCTCINITTISGNYTNVSVWAFNNSGTGNLSTSYINLNTTLLLYSISGLVHDNYGYVVSGATVTGSDGSTNTTDATGYYIIPGLLNGTYNLSFSKTGYATGYLEITLSGADAINQDITLTITNAQSAYKTSTCRSTMQWGEVGSALIIVLILLTAGGLTLGFMSGTLKIDTFPIQEFVITLVAVVVIGSIGVAIINPIIIAVGCP